MDVCAGCERQYVIVTTGVWVIQTRSKLQIAYKLYRADLYECPRCKHELLTYFGAPWDEEPISAKTLAIVASEKHYFVREFPL